MCRDVLRVALLSTDLERGGYPLRLARMAKALVTVGVEPIVGCLAPPGPVSADLADHDIKTFACNATSARDIGALRRLADCLRRFDPDIVHSALLHANIAARGLGRVGRSRPVITSTVTIEQERPWHLWAEALTSGGSDLHVVNSNAVGEHLCRDLGFDRNRLVVIPNAVDFDRIDSIRPADRAEFDIPEGAPLVVWAGRLDPVKGLDTFVDVIVELRSRLDARALLIGDGPEAARITQRIHKAGLVNIVRLAGWRRDVWAWLKTADVLLFPSRTEGSPNTVIEAMACGCPVVAGDIPACRDLIVPGEHGWLSPPSDPTALAVDLFHVLADPAEVARRTARARDRVLRRHDIQHVVRLWRGLYDRLIQPSHFVR